MGFVAKINAASVDNSISTSLYGLCGTAANDGSKIAVCYDCTTLITGMTIKVKFTYSNTAENPTLKVAEADAKPIVRYGVVPPGTTPAESWNAGAVVSFTYDGNYWQMNDWVNTDTTYTEATATAAGLMPAADKEKIDGMSIVHANNVTVSSAGWSVNHDSTYTDYYSNEVDVTGMTSDHYPIVTFNESDNDLYFFASFVQSIDGKIIIYAEVKPTTNIQIPSVLGVK